MAAQSLFFFSIGEQGGIKFVGNVNAKEELPHAQESVEEPCNDVKVFFANCPPREEPDEKVLPGHVWGPKTIRVKCERDSALQVDKSSRTSPPPDSETALDETSFALGNVDILETVTCLSDSDKYKRIKEQNLNSSKKMRIKKRTTFVDELHLPAHLEDDDTSCVGLTRRPRMNLSQLNDAAKYNRIRELNNLASKRLREKKRKHMQEITQELKSLGKVNGKLRARVEHLQAMQGKIRQLLLRS